MLIDLHYIDTVCAKKFVIAQRYRLQVWRCYLKAVKYYKKFLKKEEKNETS